MEKRGTITSPKCLKIGRVELNHKNPLKMPCPCKNGYTPTIIRWAIKLIRSDLVNDDDDDDDDDDALEYD